MQNFNSFPDKERLQQINLYLENVGKLAEAHGREWVENLLKLGWSASTVPDTSSEGKSASDASTATSSALMMDEVESLGLQLNPNLIDLIVNSSVPQVKTAIAKYKTYRPFKNPEGLFYTILKNEQKSDQSSF